MLWAKEVIEPQTHNLKIQTKIPRISVLLYVLFVYLCIFVVKNLSTVDDKSGRVIDRAPTIASTAESRRHAGWN
jgi:hypothetical protein